MKAYITRYALTKGILEIEAEFVSQTAIVEINALWTVYYHKPDWYLTREEAVAQAQEMRDKKIQSLEKSITKLKKRTF